MGRRGPPATPGEVVSLRGGKYRPRGALGQDEEGYTPKPPSWLAEVRRGKAMTAWHEKTAEYRRRGQRVQGFEALLAQYCALEAEIADDRERGLPVTAAALRQHMTYAVKFYDAPSAAVEAGTPAAAGRENPFSKRGKR